MIGSLTYTDILLIILIYVATFALAVFLYPKLRGYGEKDYTLPAKTVPKKALTNYGGERKKQADSFYSDLWNKSEKQIAEEMGLPLTHDSKPEKNLKKKKDKVNHNEA